jgi:hypothetical protein
MSDLGLQFCKPVEGDERLHFDAVPPKRVGTEGEPWLFPRARVVRHHDSRYGREPRVSSTFGGCEAKGLSRSYLAEHPRRGTSRSLNPIPILAIAKWEG